MSLSEELAFHDATAQAELVRRKQLKPIELVDAAGIGALAGRQRVLPGMTYL